MARTPTVLVRLTCVLLLLPAAPALSWARGGDLNASNPTPALSATPSREVTDSKAAIHTQRPQTPQNLSTAQPLYAVGLDLGASFSQLFSQLGTSTCIAANFGYLLPAFARRIQAQIDVSYSQPQRRETANDPRLSSDGAYTYSVRVQQWGLGLGTLYRFRRWETPLNFYTRGALRIEIQRARIKGRAGAGLGTNSQVGTELGIIAGGGLEYRFGPGALAAELSMALTDLDHLVTGEATAGGATLAVGYRLFM